MKSKSKPDNLISDSVFLTASLHSLTSQIIKINQPPTFVLIYQRVIQCLIQFMACATCLVSFGVDFQLKDFYSNGHITVHWNTCLWKANHWQQTMSWRNKEVLLYTLREKSCARPSTSPHRWVSFACYLISIKTLQSPEAQTGLWQEDHSYARNYSCSWFIIKKGSWEISANHSTFFSAIKIWKKHFHISGEKRKTETKICVVFSKVCQWQCYENFLKSSWPTFNVISFQ